MSREKIPGNSDDQIINAELEILGSRKAENNLQRQFELAAELYQREIIDKEQLGFTLDEFVKSKQGRNLVMDYWATSDYSEVYRNILKDQKFIFHSRLKAEFNNLTLADLDYYREHQKLLE